MRVSPLVSASFFLTAVFISLLVATTGQENKPVAEDQTSLAENLRVFAPLIGTWEIDAQWSSGSKLWSRNDFAATMNGKFVTARTFTKNEEGEVYQRYLTIYSWDEKKSKVVAHGFTYDGSTSVVEMSVETGDDGKLILASLWTPSPESTSEIKQHVWLKSENKQGWKAWSRPNPETEFSVIMDGTWTRVENQ